MSLQPPKSALKCAEEFLEVIPIIMGTLHCKMRRHPDNTLTMPQFRTLVFLDRHKSASLSQLALCLELGLPTTSKIVDGLVHSKAIERQVDPLDRRRISLHLSPTGKKELRASRKIAQNNLACMLAPLSDADRRRLVEALHSLHPLLVDKPPKSCN